VIPKPGKALADLAMKLSMSVIPEIESKFAASNAAMTSMLMLALAQDSERAVANRMTDIHELQTLFAETADYPAQAALTAFISRTPASLLLADVDALLAEGMALLIDLHAWAEEADEDSDRRIWQFLLRHTERNKFSL